MYLSPAILGKFDAMIGNCLVDLSILWPKSVRWSRRKGFQTYYCLPIGRGVSGLSSMRIRDPSSPSNGSSEPVVYPSFIMSGLQSLEYGSIYLMYSS